jgi:hypothetical protein
MKSIARSALVVVAPVALLTACGGSQPPINVAGAPSQSRAIPMEHGRGDSWMLPEAKSAERLLYLSNSGRDVMVYDYKTFKQVGSLTGLSTPEGECVDATGDVWILEDANGDQGGGEAVEYAHGGTTMLNEVTTNQPPGTCSVSPNGNLEITDGGTLSGSGVLGPGEVQIWKHASGSPTDYGPIASCYFLSSGGYDNKGNLYVTGTSNTEASSGICELRAGGKGLVAVKADKAITDPTGIMWDGKYMAVSNFSNAHDNYTATILQAAERHDGKELKVVGSTPLADNCFGDEVDILPAPFIVGKKNTPVNDTEGIGVLGFNFICGINPSQFRLWSYPAGGNPVRKTTVVSGGGEAVSIAP